MDVNANNKSRWPLGNGLFGMFRNVFLQQSLMLPQDIVRDELRRISSSDSVVPMRANGIFTRCSDLAAGVHTTMSSQSLVDVLIGGSNSMQPTDSLQVVQGQIHSFLEGLSPRVSPLGTVDSDSQSSPSSTIGGSTSSCVGGHTTTKDAETHSEEGRTVEKPASLSLPRQHCGVSTKGVHLPNGDSGDQDGDSGKTLPDRKEEDDEAIKFSPDSRKSTRYDITVRNGISENTGFTTANAEECTLLESTADIHDVDIHASSSECDCGPYEYLTDSEDDGDDETFVPEVTSAMLTSETSQVSGLSLPVPNSLKKILSDESGYCEGACTVGGDSDNDDDVNILSCDQWQLDIDTNLNCDDEWDDSNSGELLLERFLIGMSLN